MSDFSVSKLIDRLHGGFDVVLAQWISTSPTHTHLWELSNGKSTAEILQQDVYDVGQFFLQADEIGTQSEIYLIAECTAYLRSKENSATSHRHTEEEIESIGKSLLHSSAPIMTETFAPLCYRITQLACAQGVSSEASLDALRKNLIQLANLFLLRDGNYTSGEDARMKEFYAIIH